MAVFDLRDPNHAERRGVSPHLVQEAIDRAVTFCWMLLPEGRRNATEVGAQIRRIVERTLANLAEDEAAFGLRDAGGGRPEPGVLRPLPR